MESGRLKVLLVEDHEVLRKTFAMLLPMHCPADIVGEAGDGEEGLKAALELRPDVIITDVAMPRMDGIEMTRKVREAMPQVAVVGFSAFENYCPQMRDAGADECFVKGGDFAQVAQAVQRLGRRES